MKVDNLIPKLILVVDGFVVYKNFDSDDIYLGASVDYEDGLYQERQKRFNKGENFVKLNEYTLKLKKDNKLNYVSYNSGLLKSGKFPLKTVAKYVQEIYLNDFNEGEYMTFKEPEKLPEILFDEYILQNATKSCLLDMQLFLDNADGYTHHTSALVGMAGSGKSSFYDYAIRYFKENGYDFNYMKISPVEFLTATDWFYTDEITNNENGIRTEKVYTDFIRMLDDSSKPAIIAIEELNRQTRQAVLNAAMKFMGEEKLAYDGYNLIQINTRLFVYITMNVGWEYNGTDILDFAMTSRIFDWYEMEVPTKKLYLDLLNTRMPFVSEFTRNLAVDIVFSINDYIKKEEISSTFLTNRDLFSLAKSLHYKKDYFGQEYCIETTIINKYYKDLGQSFKTHIQNFMMD